MMFKDMVKADLSGLYASLGDMALFSDGSLDPYVGKPIFVIPEPDYDIEMAEFKVFRAIASDVVGIDQSMTLLIDDVVYSIHNFDLSDDGLEMYIGVK